MNKLNKVVALFALLTLSLVGCDYVTDPFQDNGGGPIDTSDVVMRNVLIEDYLSKNIY